MNDDGQRQRLAAILAADAVGYSRLMEADERGTARALDRAHQAFRQHVGAHQGRVINTVGDSVLAVFESAAGAVTAALAIQSALAEAERDVADDRRLRFRIGVHLGDVNERADGDVYGDGVNIAARLQALAVPGGIVVSEAVRGAVKNRVAAAYGDLGAQSVKNIAESVRAFALRAPDAAPDARATATVAAAPRRAPRRAALLIAIVAGIAIAAGAAWLLRPSPVGVAAPSAAPAPSPVQAGTPPPAGSRKPSIAVLPFDNMSGEADKAYFADGITEDLITDLSKVAGLVVIARNSTFQYKGKARDVREIGKALDARYVLEGSVRRSGDSVRVNAQLIDAATGAHVWADRYDGDLKDIFGVQDTITRNVVKALAVELTKDESARVANRGTGNVRAYDEVLKGWEHYLRQTPEEFQAAIVDFKKATEIDPELRPRMGRARGDPLGDLHALLGARAGAFAPYAVRGRAVPGQGHARADAARAPGRERDARCTRSSTTRRSPRRSAPIASDPNDADGYAALAGALSFAGRPAEALDAVERAMRLNPHYPSSYAYQRGTRAVRARIGWTRRPSRWNGRWRSTRDDYWSQRLLLAIYGLHGPARRCAAARRRR